MAHPPAAPLPEDVLRELEQGRTIEAIKRLRQATGLGLKQARDAVEAHRGGAAGASPRVHRAAASRLSPGEVPRGGLRPWVLALTVAALLACALWLAGCASEQPARLGAAAATPLSDLNLVQADIPAPLVQAQQSPYRLPPDAGCAALAAQIQVLDEVLGADLDTPATAANPGLIERGGEAAENAAVGALQRTAEGAIPFRGWVRKLSGAERHARQVSAAVAAGSLRRAFLKGLRAAQSCAPDVVLPVAAPGPAVAAPAAR